MAAPRVTIGRINLALFDAGLQCLIARGTGYFYFYGNDVDAAKEQGVYGVARLGDLTVEQWVAEAKQKCK